jgi:anti-sigma regulatory factor (Ser/Thr protein kinase)
VSRFRDEALFYGGQADFLEQTIPFVLSGLAAGDKVVVAVPEPGLSAMRQELGGAGERVMFADMARVGRNPGRIISFWDDVVRTGNGDGRPIRGVGQPVWPSRSADELVECQLHENLLNLAFAEAKALHIACPYDVSTLPADVLTEARRAHERGHADRADALAAPMRGAPAGAHVAAFGPEGVRALRREIGALAEHVGLTRSRTDDLVLAVNEVVTNSIRHGGGQGVLRTWIDGDAVVCEVSDGGRIDDPLVGRRRPESAAPGGRGLWLAHQLCDLVQIRSDGDGTVVRMTVDGGRVR